MPKNRGKRGLLGYEDYMPQIDPNEQAAIDEYASKPEQKGLLGFWQGGDKFTGRDAIAGLLAGIGDAFDREGGGDGGALDALIGGRAKAFAEAKKQAQQEQLIQAGINSGRSRDEMALIAGGAANYGDFKPAAPNDTERDYQFMVQTVGKDAADNWLRRRGDPMINMTLPNGQFYSGPQSGLSEALGGGSQIPDKPVGKLTPIGGPQVTPAGRFRR